MSKIDKRAAAAGQRWRDHPAAMVRELFGVEPDPWQIDVLECFPHQPLISMNACKGPGKLQPKSLVVETPNGQRKWGDLREGDFLFAEDGSLTRIMKRHENGVQPMYRVWFDDGSSTRAGAEHLWKVRGAAERARKSFRLGAEENWAVLTTAQIMKRGVRNKNGRWAGRQFEIPRHGPAQFPAAQQALDPYLAGVWIGDGSKGAPQYTKPYPEVEAEINRRGYETKRRADGKTVAIVDARAEFESLECFKKTSPDRFIPNAYKFASIEQRADLLSGLMDTDGCIGDDSHTEYDTTSERLANDVVWLVRSLGGVAFIKEAIKEGWYRDADGQRVDCRNCYRVTVRTPFNPFRIPHKADRWIEPTRNRSSERYLKRYIDRIEPDGKEDSMCVEIDHPSRCYLANDFIVTHNTTVLAWLCWNFLLTRPTPNIAATSISGDNLRDGLLKEMSKWFNKSPLLKSAFVITTTRIFAKQNEKNWWMAFRTWPRSGDRAQQSQTLAGLHEDFVMFVLDESGDIPPAVLVTAEAALSSCVEGHILQAGNPTSLDGSLYMAEKDRIEKGGGWKVFEVTGDPDDPKRAPRVSLDWANDQIRKYGRTSPWVLVNVLGQFPPASLNALIGEDEVKSAMVRGYREWDLANMAKILGCDVARQGDDSSVIARRRGLQMYPFRKYRNLTGIEGASAVNRLWNEFGADACFIDGTGGFGYAWIDQLSNLGRTAIPVAFNESARDTDRYYNRRAEMSFNFVEWIKNGGALPPEGSEGARELLEALIHTTYSFKGDLLLLEPKEDVKAKIGFSPDEFDSCILTFAEPVTAKRAQGHVNHNVASPYEPFAELTRRTGGGYSAVSDYNPFSSR